MIAGERAEPVLERLGSFANVDVVSAASDAVGSHAVYVLHHDDPLADVGATWARFFDGEEPVGGLEVAVEQALAALRRGATLPDYYLVLDPDTLTPTVKHWWFGVLATAAPTRVIPVTGEVTALGTALSQLPSGRWWPEPPEEWLRGLPRAVPDRVGTIQDGFTAAASESAGRASATRSASWHETGLVRSRSGARSPISSMSEVSARSRRG